MKQRSLLRPIWLGAVGLSTVAACSMASIDASTLGDDWHHDGYLVAVNQADDTADLVNLRTGRSVKKIQTGTGPHESAVSPDGKRVAITNYGNGSSPGNSLTIAALPSGEVEKTIDLGTYTRPHGVAWLSDDVLLVTSETTRNVVQVSVREGKVEKVYPTENPGSHMLALDLARKRVYTANISAANVTGIDLESGKSLGVAPAAAQSEGIAVSPDGKWVVTGNRSGSISIIETATMKKVKDISCEGVPYRAGFTPDGRRALVPCPMGRELVVVDMAKQAIEKRIPMSANPGDPSSPLAGPRGVCVNLNGRWAYVTLNESQSVAIVDLEKLAVVGQAAIGKSPDGIAYSPVRG